MALTKDSKPKPPRRPTVIAIPKEGNKIYGDDQPMPWREAAHQTGIPANTFWQLLTSRQIEKQPVGRRIMVRPSAVRAYLDRKKVSVL